MFDLSTPKEYRTHALSEYNSLHDPHLRSYLFRHDVKSKLITNGYVTKNLRVICSLREYNAYRHFLENEFMKLHKREEEERNVSIGWLLCVNIANSVYVITFNHYLNTTVIKLMIELQNSFSSTVISMQGKMKI